jgi:hypothetical protein
MTETLAVLADRLDIHDVLATYASGVDRRDWDMVSSCFAPDAHVDGTRMSGPFSEYFPFLRVELAKFDRTTHFLGNHRAGVDHDSAWAETYAVALHFWTDEHATLHRMGLSVRYADQLERRDRWRIVRRSVVADWVFEDGGAGVAWTLPAVS